MRKVGLLVLVMLVFAQFSSNANDYSKMSANELNEAFIVAVKKDSSDELQKLVRAGANINTPIQYIWTIGGDDDRLIKSTALIYAVRHHYVNVVRVLIKVVEKKELNEVLHVAIKEGYPDVVEELIKGGANINYEDEIKNTPLINAVNCRWSSQKIIQTLLKAGANVSHVNKYGRTALMEAVIEHDLNTVQSLLQIPEMTTGSYFGFGTKPINYADEDGNTALIFAVKKVRCSYINQREYKLCVNSQSIINALLKTPGINPHHVNKNGDTAIKLLEKIDKKMSY